MQTTGHGLLTTSFDLKYLRYDGRIEFVPVRKAREMRGMLKGMDTRVARDEDRL